MALSQQIEDRFREAFEEAIRLTTPPGDGGELPDRRETIINENFAAVVDSLQLLATEIEALKKAGQ